MSDIDIFSQMQKIFYLITWRVSRTSTLPSCLKYNFSKWFNLRCDIDWWFWHHWWWWKFTLLEPEDGVLELIPLKTTSSNIDTCHNEVSLAGVENRFNFKKKKTNKQTTYGAELAKSLEKSEQKRSFCKRQENILVTQGKQVLESFCNQYSQKLCRAGLAKTNSMWLLYRFCKIMTFSFFLSSNIFSWKYMHLAK